MSLVFASCLAKGSPAKESLGRLAYKHWLRLFPNPFGIWSLLLRDGFELQRRPLAGRQPPQGLHPGLRLGFGLKSARVVAAQVQLFPA